MTRPTGTEADERERMIRELLARRGVARRPTGIPRRAPDARVPLSPLQEGLWYLDSLDPGNPAYVLYIAVRLSGRVDLAALRGAVAAVVARHEALRTAVVARAGVPEQVVLDHVDCDVTVDDLTDRPADTREQAAVALVQAEVETGFDLDRAPLMRVRLIRLDEAEHVLALCLHHIVADERSLGIVLGEILTGYQRIQAGGPPPPPPTAQFPDYVLWQRAALGGRADELRRFWAARLADAQVLELPTDRPRPPVQTFAGATAPFTLAAELTAAVDALARRAGVTRFMIVMTAVQVVLSRWSGQSDICVGSPVATRSIPESQEIVGLLVNSVVFRTDLSGDPTLAEALDRVRRTCVEALAHAELPLHEVVGLAGQPRDPSRNPLFQVMCVVNPTTRVAGTGGLAVRPVNVGRRTSRLDLTVMVYETDPALSGLVDYNTDLFDAQTIRRFIDRLRQVLHALTADPHRRLSELDVIGPAERRELAAWSGTDRDHAPAATLTDLIRARAAADPDAPAVLAADRSAPVLSYGELDSRADRLARLLRAAGVGPEVPVGLALPPGPAAVVAIVGILRAGGAYLPMDPANPAARLEALLDDARAPLTVTAPAHAGRFAGRAVLVVDELTGLPVDSGAVPDAPPDGGLPAGHPDQLAYVIYTSGSTGTPKGVMVSHRSAVNLARAFVELHDIRPGDRLLMLPPLSFDASVGDLFPALISGATLVTHGRPAELTGPELLRLAAEHGITMVDTAVALWTRWVADLADQPPRTDTPLRVLMVGGEAAPTSAVRGWVRATGGGIRVYNHYGPTEATVCATTYATVDAAELPGLNHLPIGRPLPGVRVHVLDAALRPVPVGVPGELYVGGAAPARGYLGAPKATAERFVPDPFGAPGARLYRTGDLARWRSDGTLEFLGRTDRQVKIRGYRIELGEVEAACADQPGVARAAVVARDDGRGPRLVAYLVPAAGADAPDPADIRGALRRRLPEHLVPSAFVVLPELPLTPHGKLDQAALPAPDEHARAVEYVPPRTPTERALAAIWADLLGVDRVGAHDSFADLGGHSLLAGPMIARVGADLGVELPVRALFDAPDLAGLAERIDRYRAGEPASGSGTPARAGGPASDVEARARADAVLPDDLPVPNGDPAAVPEAVLVTGATGFLGAHLVADWLAHGTARLHCLVRADTPAAALARVADNLRRYGLWRDEYTDRLVGVPGDLGEPALGLSRRDFEALADSVDAVLHNGGLVNFLHPYQRLRPANVLGTREVLRLAGTGRPSAVHLVSTLGVFLTPARTGTVVRERDAPDDCAGLGDGYNATKWAADALARAARERGLRVSVYRPARITGHSRTGVGNADDYFSRLLKTFVQLGAVPEIVDDEADLAPVDYVAAGIGWLSRQPDRLGGDFHFYNNRTISFPDLAAALTDFGYPVTVLPYERWRAALLARPDAALAPFAPLFGPVPPRRTQPTFDCTVTETALASAGLVCPPADADLIHTYLAWYVQTGFLDPPARRPGVPTPSEGGTS